MIRTKRLWKQQLIIILLFVAAPLLSNCFANEAAPESAYIESLAYGHTQNLCYFFTHPASFLNPGGKYSQESLLDAYQNDKRFKKSVQTWFGHLVRGVKLGIFAEDSATDTMWTSVFTSQLLQSSNYLQALRDCANDRVSAGDLQIAIRHWLLGTELTGGLGSAFVSFWAVFKIVGKVSLRLATALRLSEKAPKTTQWVSRIYRYHPLPILATSAVWITYDYLLLEKQAEELQNLHFESLDEKTAQEVLLGWQNRRELYRKILHHAKMAHGWNQLDYSFKAEDARNRLFVLILKNQAEIHRIEQGLKNINLHIQAAQKNEDWQLLTQVDELKQLLIGLKQLFDYAQPRLNYAVEHFKEQNFDQLSKKERDLTVFLLACQKLAFINSKKETIQNPLRLDQLKELVKNYHVELGYNEFASAHRDAQYFFPQLHFEDLEN